MEPMLIANFDLKTPLFSEPQSSVWLTKYMSDDIWALLVLDQYGETISVPTVNLEGYGLVPATDHVFIEDQSADIMHALVGEGILGKPVRTLPMGYSVAYECALLIPEVISRFLTMEQESNVLR